MIYFFIDHRMKPNYDWDMETTDRYKLVEIVRPTLFFARGQTITLGRLKEYFTDKAIIKLEGDNFIKFL